MPAACGEGWNVGEAHDAIHGWCKATGRALARPSWEIVDQWIDDSTPRRPDVFHLLKR